MTGSVRPVHTLLDGRDPARYKGAMTFPQGSKPGPVEIDRAGGPMTPPYRWESSDYLGNRISLQVDFDNTTRQISGGTAFRDPGCAFKKIYVGVGADSRPDSSTRFFNVASGSQNLGQGQFTGQGWNTIEQFTAQQITAGP